MKPLIKFILLKLPKGLVLQYQEVADVIRKSDRTMLFGTTEVRVTPGGVVLHRKRWGYRKGPRPIGGLDITIPSSSFEKCHRIISIDYSDDATRDRDYTLILQALKGFADAHRILEDSYEVDNGQTVPVFSV